MTCRPPRIAVAALALALPLVLGGCGWLGLGEPKPGDVEPLALPESETAVDYEVEVVGAPSEAVETMMQESLALFRRQETGAQSLAFLRRRAEGDEALAVRILRSFGHYGAEAAAEVEALAPDPEAEPGAPGLALARMVLAPGPVYTLAEHRLVLPADLAGPDPGLPDAAALGSPVGGPAAARGILAAEQAAEAHLRAAGRPWAAIEGRRAVADPETATLSVETSVAPGPFATFGEITFEGLGRIDQDHVSSYRPFSPGAPAERALLTDWQRALSETELFSSVSIALPETPPPPGPDGTVVAPVSVVAEEGPRRRLSAGLSVDTEDGPSVRGGYLHRNLLGGGERFVAAADVGVNELTGELTLSKPQFLRPGQYVEGGLRIGNEETSAYDALSSTLAVRLRRDIGERWVVGAGALYEISAINDTTGDVLANVAGLPLFVQYDDTDDPLNRTDGQTFRLGFTPFYGWIDGEGAPFPTLRASGSVYRTVNEERGVVLAARAGIGTIFAESLNAVPANRRLYVGGGGSVRGYRDQFVGPFDGFNDPTGGRSSFEGSVETRVRLFGDVGGVAFVDAGAVSSEVALDFEAGVQYAAGLGLRYYSPVGPLRLDVAFPLNGRDVDNAFEAYFSIGQAF